MNGSFAYADMLMLIGCLGELYSLMQFSIGAVGLVSMRRNAMHKAGLATQPF